jgi:beta-N-acetylhexosaminidase
MGAVFRKGICKTAVAALAAGVDLLLISYDPDQYYAAITCAANAFERSVLDPQSLAKSRSRIRTVASYDRFSAI